MYEIKREKGGRAEKEGKKANTGTIIKSCINPSLSYSFPSTHTHTHRTPINTHAHTSLLYVTRIRQHTVFLSNCTSPLRPLCTPTFIFISLHLHALCMLRSPDSLSVSLVTVETAWGQSCSLSQPFFTLCRFWLSLLSFNTYEPYPFPMFTPFAVYNCAH